MNEDEIKNRIAGEIALSTNPGATMKKWRGIFGITQSELAEYLGITPSTISDYENNRRKSPGIQIIKRFVDALISLDVKNGGRVCKRLGFNLEEGEIFSLHDFSKPINAKEFVKLIGGRPITNKRKLGDIYLYGYTIVDSLKAIIDLPVDKFYRIYGTNPARAIIFTKVQIGRSPMVAIRVSSIKPRLVVYQGLSSMEDPVARKISDVEKIPIVLTTMDLSSIRSALDRV